MLLPQSLTKPEVQMRLKKVVNIQIPGESIKHTIKAGYLNNIPGEINSQGKIEFNYTDTDDIDDEE